MRVYCRKAIVHRPVAFGESPHPTNSQSELPTFPTRGKAFFQQRICLTLGDSSTSLRMTAGGNVTYYL